MKPRVELILAVSLLVAVSLAAQVQWSPPEEIEWRTGTIYSEGTRLAAEILSASPSPARSLLAS